MIAGTALAAAACGGGQPPATGGPYVATVNGICARLATDLQSSGPLPSSFRDPAARPRPQDLPAAAAFLERNVAILRGASQRLHAVPVPDAEHDAAMQWLAALDAFIADLAGAADAARRGDSAAFTTAAFEAAPAAASDRDSLGARLGVNGCG